jgi:hypothetical protein
MLLCRFIPHWSHTILEEKVMRRIPSFWNSKSRKFIWWNENGPQMWNANSNFSLESASIDVCKFRAYYMLNLTCRLKDGEKNPKLSLMTAGSSLRALRKDSRKRSMKSFM